MTRLSSFERQALGRSAFGAPFRDENGNFIISSRAAADYAPGYVQQFSENGRPINPESVRDERRLRRAQNEILQVVGVTRSKHELERQRAQAQGPSKQELLDLVKHENSIGSLMRILWTLPMDLSAWIWESHRSRLLVRCLKTHERSC